MTTTAVTRTDPEPPRENPAPGAGHWSWGHSFAVAGVIALVWEGWTFIAWLAQGPHALDQYRNENVSAWWGSILFETLIIVISIPIAIHVIRGCLRTRRITFDAKLCVAALLAGWQDPLANFAQPTFFYSSDWVNTNSWCGNVPLRVNPVCGAVPQPILFNFFEYAFGVLGLAIVFNAVMRAIKRRWPGIRPFQMALATLAFAMLIDVSLQEPALHLRLWAFPNLPWSLLGTNVPYPLSDLFGFSPFFTSMALLRFYKNDRDETFLDRDTRHLAPRWRFVLSLVAMVGFTNVVYTAFSLPDVLAAPYSTHMATNLPAHLMNGVCTNGTTVKHSQYGLCPGMPGYRAPLRSVP